jgi:hypothetical protein
MQSNFTAQTVFLRMREKDEKFDMTNFARLAKQARQIRQIKQAAQLQRVGGYHELGHLILGEAGKRHVATEIYVHPTRMKGYVDHLTLGPNTYLQSDFSINPRLLHTDIFEKIAGYTNSMRTFKTGPRNALSYNSALQILGRKNNLHADMPIIVESMRKIQITHRGAEHLNKIDSHKVENSIGWDQGMFAKTVTPKREEPISYSLLDELDELDEPLSTPPRTVQPPMLRPSAGHQHIMPKANGLSGLSERAYRLLRHVPDDILATMARDLRQRGGKIEGRENIETFLQHIPPENMQALMTDMAQAVDKPVDFYYGLNTLFPNVLRHAEPTPL